MRNINSEIATYREAIRHLWNSSFSRLGEALRFGVCLELYEEVDYMLFKALVCVPLGYEFKKKASNDPINDFKVIPTNPLTDVNVMINRSIPSSGYWDDPIKVLSASDVDFSLIGFFDWDEYKQKDCYYYRVRITNCTSHPHLAGKDALVEAYNMDIFFVQQ